ncbi:MAG: EAL domain-containing protein [Oscillospiraceae bacterium]|nr:EAL domain-containing protein [Oscillospiraceae bacterium]
MALVVVVLEVWMIVRTTVTYFKPTNTYPLQYYLRNYYLYYFILLAAGTLMLVFAVRFLRGKKDHPALGRSIQWVFSFICLYFGIMVSVNDYAKGEQILTFLTMELFVICLLTWRPIVAFLILTVSYGIYVWRISGIVPVNVRLRAIEGGTEAAAGLTVATKINLFTMWLSTLMFSISNYNKTLSQARKDEDLEGMNARLSEISVKDELTGIHNMFHFRSEAEKLLGYVTTDKGNIAFLFFDIENFKSYNEKYGFHEGNDLLMRVAQMMEREFEGSLVSRYSDDHFVVLTRYAACEEHVRHLSHAVKTLQREVHLELKCGAYRPADGESDPSLALDRARFACNCIKKHYDCAFRLYDKALEDDFHRKQYIVNNIDNAIENGYIKVFYQPVVSTQDGCICGLEALARWLDPAYGLLPPGAFIGILEEYRQIHKLDQCIIRQVCRDYRRAADQGLPFAPVSLNFSRLDFELCDIVDYVQTQAQAYGVPRDFLDIEITESALTEQHDYLQNAVRKLRDSGYRVWLDDFGSGYSSLNVLKDYQFDVLKIDMKFLSDFGSNEKAQPILENIVSLTRQLNMVSLTEGVETQEQFAFLRDIGCERAQGYLFSKPVPIEQLRERIRTGELHMAKAS